MVTTKFKAQKRLTIVWIVNSGLLALIFIFFTVTNRFDDSSPQAWEWYSQNLVPIFTLMISTFYTNMNQQDADKTVDVFYFKLSLGISIFYLSVLYLTLFLAPLAFALANLSIIELFERSKIYLIIFQGVVTFSLGLFFNKAN